MSLILVGLWVAAVGACGGTPGAAPRGTDGGAGATAGTGGTGGPVGAGGVTGEGGDGTPSASTGTGGAATESGHDASATESGHAATEGGQDVATTDTRVDAGAAVALRALSVTTGRAHGCALLEDHTVKCWGAGGEWLGYGDARARGSSAAEMGDALPAVDLGSGRTATAISASYAHTCAILDDGSVKCWGQGAALGLADTTSRGAQPGQMGDALPALDLGAGRKARQIAAGFDWSCALLDDDTMRCWGDKSADPAATHMLPTTVPLGTTARVRSVVADGHGIAVLLEDGVLLGQLPGLALTQYGARVAAFAGARQSRCALFVGGGATCTSAAGGTVPSTIKDLVAVGVGENEDACGLSADGAARCWGFTASQGSFWTDGTKRDTGTLVVGPKRLVAIASGGDRFTCALDADGRVWCWGDLVGPMLGASATVASTIGGSSWGPVDLGTRR